MLTTLSLTMELIYPDQVVLLPLCGCICPGKLLIDTIIYLLKIVRINLGQSLRNRTSAYRFIFISIEKHLEYRIIKCVFQGSLTQSVIVQDAIEQ